MSLMSRVKGYLLREEVASTALEIVGSILVGVLAGVILLAATGYDPIQGMYYLLVAPLTTPGGVSYVLVKPIFIILTGIAFAIPALAGVFNIGGEGQLYAGAITALAVGLATGNFVLALLGGVVAGSIVGLFIGWLKETRGANEVVTAIMLNLALFNMSLYLVTNVFGSRIYPNQSESLPKSAMLGYFFIGRVKIYYSLILSIALAVVAYFLVYHTSVGYWIRVAGASPKTAKYAGISPSSAAVLSMLVGGAFGGAAGALAVAGYAGYIDVTLSSLYGLGFAGIGVALMGRNHPIGIVFSSMFFSLLIVGGGEIERNLLGPFGYAPKELADAVSGLIIVALALPYAYRMLIARVRQARIAKKVGGGKA